MSHATKREPEVAIPDSPELILPDHDDPEMFRCLEQMLRKRQARLIGPEDQIIEIPAKMHDAMVQFAHLLATNNAVMVTPISKNLTTQEAAIYLGVSRPTVVKLLDDGAIPYTRPGKHRRIRFEDLKAYRERQHAERMLILDELTQEAEEMGGYNVSPETLEKFRAA